MDLVKLGKMIFAVTLLVFGLNHFMNAEMMTGLVPSFIPGGAFWVYLTGLGLVAAGVAILMNKMVRLAALLTALMLVIFVLTIHLPGVMGGGDAMMMSMSALLKDTAMACGALMIAGMASK